MDEFFALIPHGEFGRCLRASLRVTAEDREAAHATLDELSMIGE
ncbi:hypothetical protein AB1L42_12530 [Thalassoglobus sp. JC818]